MEENKLKKISTYRMDVYEFEKEGDVVVSIYKGPNFSNLVESICIYSGSAAQEFIKDFHK